MTFSFPSNLDKNVEPQMDNLESQESKSEIFLVSLKDPQSQRILNHFLQKSDYKSEKVALEMNKWFEEIFDVHFREIAELNHAELQVRFLYSILRDLISWGAKLEIHESQLFIRKYPQDKVSTSGNKSLRSAMTNLKSYETEYEIPIGFTEATDFVLNGHFKLVRVDAKNEGDAKIFRSGISTWSMPYRGREGRSSRYILKVEFRNLSIPCGIIEIGDDAPHSPLRDKFLGFVVPNLDSPLNPKIQERLCALRKCMKIENLPIDPTLDLANLQREWLEKNLDNWWTPDAKLRKRMNYLSRIFKGELALSNNHFWNQNDIAGAIRALKDVTLNRVHTEVVICGALPPFGPLLIGKLTAMMMNHPLVRESLNRDIGILLQETFEVSKLEKWLPRFGPLLVTTKGLFPDHSSQYNRVRIPTHDSYIPLKKLGNTIGQTMSNISDLSMKLAVGINDRLGSKGISRDYGSGGSKRQRILQRAAHSIGIDSEMLYASVSRPVYGLQLVKNADEVVLAGAQPIWVDSFGHFDSAQEYEEKVEELWRKQWTNTIMSRLSREEVEWERNFHD